MRIENSTLLHPAPLGMPLTTTTPPPSLGGQKAMDGDCHPAVDVLPSRSYRDCIHIQMLQNDFTGEMAAFYGLEIGFYIRRARCFTMYGQHAPKVSVHPLKLEPTVQLSESIIDVFPYRCSALLVTVETDTQTKPGKYRTNLEIEGEASVFYLPVVIDVADAAGTPVEITTLQAPADDPLDILFSSINTAPAPLYTGNDYAGLLYRAALHNRMLYETARKVDPLLTNCLLTSLSEIKTHVADDAALLKQVRRTLVYRLDSRFNEGNREPLSTEGGI